MNKYGKKWGVKVYDIELPNVEEAGRHMWAVDITPEMKESVMQGQVMFSKDEPTGRGAFGDIYDQFKGRANDAFKFLLWKRGGDLRSVWSREDIGNIDLVWGSKESNAGVEHILDKHVGVNRSFSNETEAAEVINDVIVNGNIDFRNGDKAVLRKDDRLVVIRKNWREKGKKIADKNWILTAYDKTSADSESPVATNKSLAGSATDVSGDKGTTNFSKEDKKSPIRNENFKKWFGDWETEPQKASKVVDENGEPLVVYHGTNSTEEKKTWNKEHAWYDTEHKKFNVFKTTWIDGNPSAGHFFVADENNAGGYGNTVYPAYLNIRKPLVIDCKGANFASIEHNGKRQGTYDWAEEAQAQGYDGVIFKNIRDGVDIGSLQEPVDEYVVFESTQIKSATENTGQFDGKNPDIRFSKENAETLFTEAKKHFGRTYDLREAGYILPDGTMLDFSGKHMMEDGADASFLSGRRSVDHREIRGLAYERDGNTKTGIETDMTDFIRSGAIRIDGNAGLINLSVKPTPEQRELLRRLVSRNGGQVQVEIGDGDMSEAYVEYDNAKPSRVLADIDRYFDEGIVPQGDVQFSKEDFSINSRKTSEDDLQIGEKFVSLHSERDREAVREQRGSMSPTAQWREGVGDVVIHSILPVVRKKYADLHEKAKAGDVEAAAQLVEAVVKEDRIKALVERYPQAKVAYVHAQEATGTNMIPDAYADAFVKYGLGYADIIQTNKPQHTGSDRIGRMIRRARFDGDVEAGTEYILVDDHVTMGGTLRDLKDYIESKGGKVVAVTTLTASAGGSKLQPTAEQIEQLKQKGITNEQLKELGIADDIAGLTKGEARELLVLADARADRRNAQGRTGDDGLAQRAQGEAGSSGQSVDYSKEAPAPREGESPLEYSQRVMAWEREQSEAQELSDSEVKFSKRTKDEPKKKGVGYKVFYLKDGKLYPPMVANPGGEDTPMGVWLDADAAPVVAETKSGRKKVKAGGKGTQGGSGQLAYRPGWHLGEIPYALQFNRENAETGEKELFPARFVWAEVEYANDKDYQKEAESYGMTENGKFRHSYAGLPRVPEDGAYKYRTNPDPNTDPWIITGAMRVNRLLTPSEVDEMVTAAGREPQKREQGAVTDAEIEALNGGTHVSQTVPRVFSEGSNPNSQTNGDVRFSKESFDPFGVESDEQKEIWKNAILSLDTPRRALAPGTSGITKPLSAANVRKLDDITKGFEHLKRDIAKKSLNRDDFLLRIAGSLGFRNYKEGKSRYGEPIVIGDGVQYSARMVVKQYENNNIILDELSLYHLSMHKEITSPHTNLSAIKDSGVQYDNVISEYKVKDLIYSTQENDQKLLGIADKSQLNFSKETENAPIRTENFKKWFGDWENEPQKASKVVEEASKTPHVYTKASSGRRMGDLYLLNSQLIRRKKESSPASY